MASDDVLSQIAPWRRTLDCQRGIAAAAAFLLLVLLIVNGAVAVTALSRHGPADFRRVFGNADNAVLLLVVCSAAAATAALFVGALLSCFTPDRAIARWARVSFAMIGILLAVILLMWLTTIFFRNAFGIRPTPEDCALVGALAGAAAFGTWMTSQALLGQRFGVARIGTKVAVYCAVSLMILAIDWYVHTFANVLFFDRATRFMVAAHLNLAAASIVLGGYLAIVLPIQRAMSRSLHSAENRTSPEPIREVEPLTPDGRRWGLMRRGLSIMSAGTIVLLATSLLTELLWFAAFNRFHQFRPERPLVFAGIFLVGVGLVLIAIGLFICCGSPDRNSARSAYLAVASCAITMAVGTLLYTAPHEGRIGSRYVWFLSASIAGVFAVAGFVNGVLVFSAMSRAFGVTRVGLFGALYTGFALGALTFAFLANQSGRGFPRASDFLLARFFDTTAAVVAFGGPLILIYLTRSAIRLRDGGGEDA